MPSATSNQTHTYLYLIAGLLVLAIGFGFYAQTQRNQFSDKGEYKAVFLTNNQVYFGKIARQGKTSVTLTDVFYYRDSQLLNGEPTGGDIALTKMGKELHAPLDQMEIVLDNILFVQTLSSNSKVLAAIQQYKTGR